MIRIPETFRITRASQTPELGTCIVEVGKLELSSTPLCIASIEGKVWIASFVTRNFSNDFALSVRSHPLAIAGMMSSLVRVSIIVIEEEMAHADGIVTIDESIEEHFPSQNLGFARSVDKLVYPIIHSAAKKKAAARQWLLAHNTQHTLANGFAVDVSQYGDWEGLSLLNREYNSIAWGIEGWAKQANTAKDEFQVISRFGKGKNALEVGAGAGRVTFQLGTQVSKLTATDYTDSVITVLNASPQRPKNTIGICDDIVSTTLPKLSFDLITWWENGLGAILNPQDRKTALANISSLMCLEGTLILGLRRVGSTPLDHVMPTSRCSWIVGTYHTFTPEEMGSLVPPKLSLIEKFLGDTRPAGGNEFFMIYKKNC